MFRICPPNIKELQKSKEDRNCHIYNSVFFKCPIRLTDNRTINFRKRKECLLIQDFYIRFCIKFKICPLNIMLIQKTKKWYQF